jgi:outer membrane receptor protein involved in Fe transport
MTKRFTKASLLTGSIMAGALLASPALAQQDDESEPAMEAAPDDEEETLSPTAVGAGISDTDGLIVVTGSRIARRNVDTAAPIAVVQDEEFALSGTVNVENVINTLPQVIPGTTANTNNPGNGAATLNLRGLGEERTLVLVNGRRWLSFDVNQIVDLNTIPQFLLDSVDVVTGGASAVYGSDAIAGVVNFRLRQVEGAELGGQYSITERGDAARYQVHGAIGTSFDDGRGSATVYAEYFNREELFQGERGFSSFALGGLREAGTLFAGGSSLPPETRLAYLGDGDIDGTAFEEGDSNLAIFDPAGDLRPYDAILDAYNYAPVNYLQLPQERYLLGGFADYDIGAGNSVYTEVTYVNNRVAAELAPTPILVNVGLPIDRIAQFLDAETLAEFNAIDESETGADQDDGIVDVQVRRRLVEAGGRNNLDERSAYRVLFGMRGPIADTLNYDVYYQYARTRNFQRQQGNASVSRFIDGLTGNLGVADPINIFGVNTLTPEMVDSFRVTAQNGESSTLQVASGVISGTFGDFAIGLAEPVGFAVGAEYRKVAATFEPDEFLASGDVQGFNAGEPTSGSYDVKEAFAELNVPVEFGGARLELSGAARYSDYSLELVGDVFTYAGGVQFAPVPDVILRGQYQRAVRAPNVGELFQGSAIGFPQVVDPCTTAAATSGTLRELCIANGVPAANLGQGIPSAVQPDQQIPAAFGGNPNLFEETSESYTFGVVLQPSFVPGFTITADYFDIKVEDAISTISLQTAFDICFGPNGTQDLSSPECANFVGRRGPSGDFNRSDLVPLGGANIAALEVSGIDLEMSYSTTIPFSLLTDTGEQGLNLSFLGTWTEESSFSPIADDPTTTFDCAGFFGGACGTPTPEFKWAARASFFDGPLTTSIRWRHLDRVEDQSGALANADEFISAYDLVDLTFAFEADERLTLTLGVNNLFDTLPGTPIVDPATGDVINDPNNLLLGGNASGGESNTYPNTYDVLGRSFFASVFLEF